MTGFLWIFLAASIFMLGLWWRQTRTLNANAVDLFWALGVGLSAIFWGVFSEGDSQRRIMMACFGAFWSARLAWHLWFYRVRHATEEDSRYRDLRESWSQKKFLVFFQAQAVIIVLFSVPFFIVAQNETRLGAADFLGALIFFVSIFGESLADRQLESFRSKKDNRGKVCREGLWRYSRHPNYFFECVHWISYVFLSWGSSFWYLSLIGPIAMTFFIFKVTGIPYAEKSSMKTKGEAYREYQDSTSVLIPWFPKKTEKSKESR